MALDSNSSYYDEGGIETFAIIKAKLTDEQWEGFLLGNVLKYSCRANWKNTTIDRDLEKASVYLSLLRGETNIG
jgi:hypothetical protein